MHQQKIFVTLSRFWALGGSWGGVGEPVRKGKNVEKIFFQMFNEVLEISENDICQCKS